MQPSLASMMVMQSLLGREYFPTALPATGSKDVIPSPYEVIQRSCPIRVMSVMAVPKARPAEGVKSVNDWSSGSKRHRYPSSLPIQTLPSGPSQMARTVLPVSEWGESSETKRLNPAS